MGRLFFVIDEKVLLNFFTVPLFFFPLAAQELLKIKVSVEPCLVSVVVLMRGCSGTDEYEAGGRKKSQYTHYKKNRALHPSIHPSIQSVSLSVYNGRNSNDRQMTIVVT